MTDRNTPLDFSYETQPARIVFRPGAAVSATPDEAARLGLRRVLVVCGSRGEGTARAVADALGEACAGLHAEARMHVPVELADRAVEAARAAAPTGASPSAAARRSAWARRSRCAPACP